MTSRTPSALEGVLPDLARFIQALGEYRKVTILAGGFVPFFYRRMPGFTPPSLPGLMTSDIDWTLPVHLEVQGGRRLAERLVEQDLVVIHSRGTEPPVQRYQHIRFGRDDLGPIYGEFLTPLMGSEVGRDGTARTVQTVQEGLTAQALRYLDLLFESSIDFDAATIPELGLTGPHVVRLPHPATYVLQKLLAWPARDPDKRAKDLAYIFEVALLTRDQWPKAGEVIENLRARDRKHSVWIRRAQQLVERQFQSPAAEGPVAVARIYRDVEGRGAAPSENAVYTIVRRFAEAVGLGTARP